MKRPEFLSADGGAIGRERAEGVARLRFLLVLLVGVFLGGIVIGYLRTTPLPLHQIYHSIRERLVDRPPADREVLNQIFGDLLIDETLYPPITTMQGVKAANDSLVIPISEFPTAYDNIRLTGAARIRLGSSFLLRVDFALAGGDYQAFAYLARPDWDPASRRAVGTLIIPGTGSNISSAIMARTGTVDGPTALDAFERADSDLFIFIKPNEDALAFHDGRRKLSHIAVKNYQLNRGGSYGASYIIHSLAITKFLRSQYSTVVVGGVSQGGQAALINALQAAPDVAVIASGYTAFGEILEIADFNQMILPSYWSEHLAPSPLVMRISQMPTRFLLTWGLRDTPLYRLDAENRHTCRMLAQAPQLTCTTHPGRHEFPVEQVQGYLAEVLTPTVSTAP